MLFNWDHFIREIKTVLAGKIEISEAQVYYRFYFVYQNFGYYLNLSTNPFVTKSEQKHTLSLNVVCASDHVRLYDLLVDKVDTMSAVKKISEKLLSSLETVERHYQQVLQKDKNKKRAEEILKTLPEHWQLSGDEPRLLLQNINLVDLCSTEQLEKIVTVLNELDIKRTIRE